MKRPILLQLSLYSYRYIIGYGLFAVLIAILLFLNITDLPRGLSSAEIDSATHSATESVGSILLSNPINAPYALLQKVSLALFGITPLAIKLPSLILAFATAMVLALTLRQWFRDNVAVLASVIVATAGPFMTMGRTGIPLILYAFWLSVILLSATKRLYKPKGTLRWKLIFFASAALSLYTPMMIYPLIAITIAGLLHPHVRYVIRNMSMLRISIVTSVALVLLAPLIWSVFQNPTHIGTLLGIPEVTPGWDALQRNITIIGTLLFDFGTVRIGEFMFPLFGAATMTIVMLGVFRVVYDSHSARSYMLLIWSGLVLLLTILNPAALVILYMPVVFFLAVGIETLIREWYRLFPRNPYARVAALIPLAILIVSICTSNIARYFYGYAYTASPNTFSQELTSIRKTMSNPALQDKSVTLVVPSETLAFYGLLHRDYENLSITDKDLAAPHSIVTEERFQTLNSDEQSSLGVPYRIVATGATEDALLLRVYVSQ